jgi:AcrR family transcriptional regulator
MTQSDARRKPGRPRASAPRWDGADTGAEILDAAAELFTTHGYGSVTTRQLADAAGIRQATMYHYFPGKKGILLALLIKTVEPSVHLSRSLLSGATASDAPGGLRSPADTLRQLATEDADLLLTDKWNVATLYGAPEIRDSYFEKFHALRNELRDNYLALARRVTQGRDLPDSHLELPFYIVESVIRLRAERESAADPEAGEASTATRALAEAIADAAVQVLDSPTGD